MSRLLLVGALLCGAVSCSPYRSIDSALDDTARRSCDWYNKCQKIGSGRKYSSYDACTSDARSKWSPYWLAFECDNKMHISDLERCWTAINDTPCENPNEVYAPTSGACGSREVCSG